MLRVTDAFEKWFREVGSVLHVHSDYFPANRYVPAIIAQGGLEGLVDYCAVKVVGERVVREHVADGIGLALDPEAVMQSSVAEKIAKFAFVGIGDDIVVFRPATARMPSSKRSLHLKK